MPLFYELAIIFGLSGIFGLVASRLKQPPLVGYIVSGIIVGGWGVTSSGEHLELFSRIGIVFLLFAVGLHLNPEVLKQTGRSALLAGVGQIIFTFLVGLALLLAFGVEHTKAVYMAMALTFSSTIVVVKILTDKRDLEKLYAKIAIGILIVQDVVASLFLMASSMSLGGGLDPYMSSADLIGKICMLSILLIAFSAWVIPGIFKKSAQSGEAMFLLSVSWGIGVAAVFSVLGLSMEIGALLAGVALSYTPYAEEIGSRLKPVRDLFLVLFFVLLGMNIKLGLLPDLLPKAALISGFVLLGGPVITWLVLRAQGQGNKVALFAGLAMAQVSEFSLILMEIARKNGQVEGKDVMLVTLVMVVTIIFSSYMMQHNERIFTLLLPLLRRILPTIDEKKDKNRDGYEIALFGHDRVGGDFVSLFSKMKKSFFVVDFNPEIINSLKAKNLPAFYGDADDIEFLETLPTNGLGLVVSTIPDLATSILLCKYLRKNNSLASFVGIAHKIDDAGKLYEAGAAYVIMPHYLGARHAVRIIREAKMNRNIYRGLRNRHMKRLGLKNLVN